MILTVTDRFLFMVLSCVSCFLENSWLINYKYEILFNECKIEYRIRMNDTLFPDKYKRNSIALFAGIKFL